jgi:hypothetical protein
MRARQRVTDDDIALLARSCPGLQSLTLRAATG